jgi:hypothetical protein
MSPDIIDFPHKSHSLTIDSAWREVADTSLTLLKEQNQRKTSSPYEPGR